MILLSISILIFLLFVLSLYQVELLFPILFGTHFLTGVLNQFFHTGFLGSSLTGLTNMMTITLYLVSVMSFMINRDRFQHDLLKYYCLCVLFFLPTLIINYQLNDLIRFFSRTAAYLLIYYFCQLWLQKTVDSEEKIILFLKIFFMFSVLAGSYNLLQNNFDYQKCITGKFNFFIFEFPHSFTIFISSLVPIFIYYIHSGRISRKYFVIIFVFLPIIILYSGAKIGLITFFLCIMVTIATIYRNSKRYYLAIILLIFIASYLFYISPVFTEIQNIFSKSIWSYIYDTRTYSENSFHTRVKTWVFMTDYIFQSDKWLFGEGWRSWNNVQQLYNLSSSQSDYFTYFFDTGIIGLLGFLLFRFLVILQMFKYARIDQSAFFLAIGMIFSLFLGGLSENVEGYPSTSWLLPVMFAFSGYLSRPHVAVLSALKRKTIQLSKLRKLTR